MVMGRDYLRAWRVRPASCSEIRRPALSAEASRLRDEYALAHEARLVSVATGGRAARPIARPVRAGVLDLELVKRPDRSAASLHCSGDHGIHSRTQRAAAANRGAGRQTVDRQVERNVL